MAEVWLDDYKNIYYERINNNLGEFGNITDRVELRKNLQCKRFLFIPTRRGGAFNARPEQKSHILAPFQLRQQLLQGQIHFMCHLS